MELNFLGLIAAVTAFISIWIGHVSVRKIEAVTVKLWKPIITAIAIGVTLGYAALAVSNRPLSTVCGILSITLLWDAFEIKRQAKRIRKGHAPANLNNPRHAFMLAAAGSHATTLDILKRDPIGRPVSHDEAIQLIADH
jgi:uncharacterized membrane protein YfcA